MDKRLQQEMVYTYLRATFKKTRVKTSNHLKRFEKAIIIPITLNKTNEMICTINSTGDNTIVFMNLFTLLKDVFIGFDYDIIQTEIYKYLGSKKIV
jgi:hypothetical protein